MSNMIPLNSIRRKYKHAWIIFSNLEADFSLKKIPPLSYLEVYREPVKAIILNIKKAGIETSG